jgi:hypothetical protein
MAFWKSPNCLRRELSGTHELWQPVRADYNEDGARKSNPFSR